MRQLAGMKVRHAQGVTVGVESTAVNNPFIRKSPGGITRTLTDECMEFAAFFAHLSTEAEVTRMIGNPACVAGNPFT
ncbi:hypothetical protein ACVVJ5_003163 [Salmonella enterica subsp. diarizonae serovar 48:r:z]